MPRIKPCLSCGRPTKNVGSHCRACTPTRQQRGYDAEYVRNRAVLISEVKQCLLQGAPVACYLCRRLFVPGDKITAEHIVPKRDGGSNQLANLAPAHERCNKSRMERRQ